MNIILKPKITKLAITQITADKNPVAVPINIAAMAQRFSLKKFTKDANKLYPILILNELNDYLYSR